MRSECGALASLFYLGEYLYDRTAVEKTLQQQMAAARALAEQGLEIHVSVDPTQIGLSIDRAFASENAKAFGDLMYELASRYPELHPRMMIDMEDHTTVEDTVQLHRATLAQGVPAAITLQAYLRRTMDDVRALTTGPNMVRLVKGAFVAGPDVAYTRKEDILESYRALLREMFSPAARAAGFYPVVATHDPAMHAYAIEVAGAGGWRPDQWEFELLLGIAENRTRALLQRGFRVRLYTPFGEDWWPYAIRRVGEHPHHMRLMFAR